MRLLRWLSLTLVFISIAQAQMVVPTFASDEDVPAGVVDTFMLIFRAELGQELGLTIIDEETHPLLSMGSSGIIGSLDSNLLPLIAELGSGDYAISGRVSSNGEDEYSVNLIVGEAITGQTTDILSQSFSTLSFSGAVRALSQEIRNFVIPNTLLDEGAASIFISTDPPNADVYIDDVYVGQTPLQKDELLPGRHIIEFRLDGFLVERSAVNLTTGNTTTVRKFLTRIVGGSILVDSEPSALIYIDGDLRGETPATIAALPGEHQVRLVRPGFSRLELSVEVKNYQVNRVKTTLEPLNTPMVFWDDDRTRRIFINGEQNPYGFIAQLPLGTHLVEVLEPETRAFEITIVQDAVYFLDLESGIITRYEP